jgi:hypothetical protein
MTTLHDIDTTEIEARAARARTAVAETYPALDLTMLHALVAWAEQDENFADLYAGWGAWTQSAYGIEIERAANDRGWLSKVTWAGNVCGSAYCIAGQTVVQHGYRMQYESDAVSGLGGGPDPITSLYGRSAERCVPQRSTGIKDCHGEDVMVDVQGGESRMIHEVARELLGLTGLEASCLFDGDNTVDMLKGLINGFCESRCLADLFPGVPVLGTEAILY